jgi:hypothetical protein
LANSLFQQTPNHLIQFIRAGDQPTVGEVVYSVLGTSLRWVRLSISESVTLSSSL